MEITYDELMFNKISEPYTHFIYTYIRYAMFDATVRRVSYDCLY